ncbi:MAG: hypothetical protein HYX32_03700 [Actinobacteria bacterium]|nr:hypothetical protein [Actinomycetota bacterium]
MTLLLATGRQQSFARGVTSEVAVDMTSEAFRVSSIDWHALGFSQKDVDELVDVMLRIVASMLIDPPHPPCTNV